MCTNQPFPASRNTESLLLEEKSRADNLQKKLSELHEEKESQLATERQTISLLVTEKAALTAELEKREDAESSKSPYHYLHVGYLHETRASNHRRAPAFGN